MAAGRTSSRGAPVLSACFTAKIRLVPAGPGVAVNTKTAFTTRAMSDNFKLVESVKAAFATTTVGVAVMSRVAT